MAMEPDMETTYEAYYYSAYPPSRRGIPAWSLHRLIEMMPRYVHTDYNHYERTLFADSICYYKELYNDCGEDLIAFDSPNLYDRVIHMYEWLIKEGYFNKEYLV